MGINEKFELRGVNHIALVSSDMARTVRFYRDVLGMPLVKTLDLPDGKGQHFFFDIGNNDCLRSSGSRTLRRPSRACPMQPRFPGSATSRRHMRR
jgi:catechol 2,3-dioxygenase-like lactoylglutathione lyase family enzyme